MKRIEGLKSVALAPCVLAPLSHEMSYAKKLAGFLKGRRLLLAPPRLRQWAYYFHALSKEFPDTLIRDVLGFYCERYDTLGLRLHSAKAFAGGFGLVLKAYKLSPESVQLNDMTESLLVQALRAHWPPGLHEHLVVIIQRSYENYIEFITSAQPPLTDRKLEKLWRYLWDWHINSPRNFIGAWLQRINETVKDFRQWNGRVDGLIWTLDSPRFTKLAREWTMGYYGDGSLWDELRKVWKC